MADETPPIRPNDAEDFARAAASVKRSAESVQRAAGKAERAARATEGVSEQIRRRMLAIERRLSVQSTEGGRFYVEERLGRGRAQQHDYAMREGRQRPSYFRSPEAAQAERRAIALERAQREAAAAATETTEKRKTTAVQAGTRARTRASADEARAISGNAQEFERIAKARADDAARELATHRAYQERVQAGRAPAPGTPAFQAQKTQQRADAEAIEQKRIAPTPPPPPPTVDRAAEERAAAADRRVARERQRREDDRAARARAAQAAAAQEAARLETENVTRAREAGRLRDGLNRLLEQRQAEEAREAARRPGTEIVRHPTEFGRRVPGPFGGPGGAGDVVGAGSSIVPGEFFRQQRVQGGRERRRAATDVRQTERFAAEQKQSADAMDAARKSAAALDEQEGRLARQMERTAIAADLSSQRFRKHGALTTEFIEAAARGEVTMRELGYQVTATIGKFAGWTAAASAVYGVTAALAEMARGAIDSASGVSLVSRVIIEDFDPGRAQEAFRRQSEQFNLPIADVAESLYGAGKVFNDLDSAIAANESSLFAMKVGELSAAEATESLAAISKGFRLEAEQLPAVFDTINEATNRYGGNVGKLTQGMGRAAGQFHSAGGSIEELNALLVAGSRLTGAPATEIATAIGRSASVVRTPAGAARARAAGLDPSLDPLALIQQAQRLARGASPERIQELARAIIPSGGQFARIFVPLIENAELLNSILADTTPEKTKGSAQRELEKVLSAVSEEISKVANGLQRLGAALAESGFLTPIALLLKALNTTLTVVTEIVAVFAKIPDPFKSILATALELYGVLRLMRRFDIGGQLPRDAPGGVRGFLGASPERRERTQITQGLSAQERFLASRRERVAQEAAVEASREQSAARRFQVAVAGGDRDKILRRQAEHARIAQRAGDLAEEEGDLRRQINTLDAQRTDVLRRMKEGEKPATAALAAGISYRTAGVERPTTAGPVPIAGGAVTPGGVILPRVAGGAAGITAGARGVAAIDAEMTRTQRAARTFASQSARVGITGRALGSLATGIASTARAGAGGLRAAGTGLARAASGLAAMLGPLDLALIGLIGGIEAINFLERKMEERNAELERLTAPSADPEELRRRAEEIVTRPGTPERDLTPRDVRERALREQLRARARQQEYQRSRGVGLTQEEIARQLETAGGGRAGQVGALRTAIASAGRSFEVLYGEDADAAEKVREWRRQLIGQLAALTGAGKEVMDALREIDDFKGLSGFTETQGAAIGLGGRGRRPLEALGSAFIRASELFGVQGDPVAYLQELENQEQAVLESAEDRLERTLEHARSPRERRVARRRFLGQARRGFGVDQARLRLDAIDVANRRRREQIEQLRAERDRIEAAPAADPLTGQALLGGLPASTERVDARIRRLRARIGVADRDERAIRRGLTRRLRLLRELRQDLARAEFDEQGALFEARTALGAGRQPAGLPRVRYEIRRQGQLVARVLRQFGRRSVEYLNAVAQQDALMAQAVQEQASLITARAELRASEVGPAGAGGQRIAGLQELLGFQRAHPQQFGEAERLGTQTQINEAARQQAEEAKQAAEDAKQRAEEARQNALDLISARFEYLRSLTDNPVQLARLEQREAETILQRGGFQNQAERYRALANRNNARRNTEQVVTDRKLETLTFQHDIGRLGDDAYLRGMRALLRDLDKGSEARRNLRRQILRFKHDLEGSEDFPELNVGDIRLPTTYDVRRMIRQGTETRPRGSVQQSNTYNFVVRSEADVEAVGGHLERINGTSVKAGMRAAGLAG